MEPEDNPELFRIMIGVTAPHKAIICGVKYDIRTADKVFDLPIMAHDLSDITWELTSLYRTRGGAFFLAGWGLEWSRWACEAGGDIYPGSGIKPISDEQVRTLFEECKQIDLYEKYFGEVREAGALSESPHQSTEPNLRLDRARLGVTLFGADGTLSKQPFDLLWILAEAGGAIVEHRTILARLWSQPRTKAAVNDAIRDLREGLAAINPRSEDIIDNKTGQGYRLVLDLSEIALL